MRLFAEICIIRLVYYCNYAICITWCPGCYVVKSARITFFLNPSSAKRLKPDGNFQLSENPKLRAALGLVNLRFRM